MPSKGEPKSLHAAMTDVPDPPCVKCALFEACAQQELACYTFRAYVTGSWQAGSLKTEPTRYPTRRIYDLIKAGQEFRA